MAGGSLIDCGRRATPRIDSIDGGLVVMVIEGRNLESDGRGPADQSGMLSWAALDVGDREVEIGALYVLPEHRGHGVGTALTAQLSAQRIAYGRPSAGIRLVRTLVLPRAGSTRGLVSLAS